MTPTSQSARSNPQLHAKRPGVFSKVFRWQAPDPAAPLPALVEIAGSFNGWQKAPLKYDRASGVWTLTLENIPGNRTHTYMLLVNGRPTSDKNSDGFAVPKTEEEKQYALETPRGPRVFIMFSQTK
jgi:1,4-alpha-glucan branching enzyme